MPIKWACLEKLLNSAKRCPLAHLVVRFAFDCSIKCEHGVYAEFPDSQLDCGLPFAEDDFALIFVAAQLALDGNVST
jgi:hypothetical protein